jgi:hypothetical protein
MEAAPKAWVSRVEHVAHKAHVNFFDYSRQKSLFFRDFAA